MNYNPFINTSIQMIVGGLGLFIASWIMGGSYHFSVTFEVVCFDVSYFDGSLVAMASLFVCVETQLPMQIVSHFMHTLIHW